jgi:membrane-associated phospholipid phosphatase
LGSEALEETGFAVAEAAVFSGAAVAARKVAAGRSRPGEDQGSGTFHPARGALGGGRSSFPSQHAALAFAAPSAASGRHPALGWAAYPLAALVALSRVHEAAPG